METGLSKRLRSIQMPLKSLSKKYLTGAIQETITSVSKVHKNTHSLS